MLRDIVAEVMATGTRIRHLALVGKEVLDTPERLFDDVLEPYHRASVSSRPHSVGIITSGHGLAALSARFVDYPLSWMILSLDTASTGLRVMSDSVDALAIAARLKGQGGVGLLGVNTILTDTNLPQVLSLGRALQASPLDNWVVAPLLSPREGGLASTLGPALVRRAAHELARLASDTGHGDTIFEVDDVALEELRRDGLVGSSTDRGWRMEYQVPGSRLRIMTPARTPNWFVRIRHDALMMTRKEFLSPKKRTSGWGHYEPGRLDMVLRQMELAQHESEEPRRGVA